jgi:hypothetical protein
MMYGLNREVEFHDMPQIRAIARDAAGNNFRFSDVILGIVNSDAFRMQAPPHEAGDKNHATLTTLAAVPHPPIPAGSSRE